VVTIHHVAYKESISCPIVAYTLLDLVKSIRRYAPPGAGVGACERAALAHGMPGDRAIDHRIADPARPQYVQTLLCVL
jgi:hypothetical protein